MPRRGVPGFSATRLREALEAAQLSPAGLARAAGIAPSDVSKYINGQAAPQPGRFAALARALGIRPATLLDDTDRDQLARLRAAAGFTQAEICGVSGVDGKRYEAAEAGRRHLNPDDLARIAAALDLPAEVVEVAHDTDTAAARARSTPTAHA